MIDPADQSTAVGVVEDRQGGRPGKPRDRHRDRTRPAHRHWKRRKAGRGWTYLSDDHGFAARMQVSGVRTCVGYRARAPGLRWPCGSLPPAVGPAPSGESGSRVQLPQFRVPVQQTALGAVSDDLEAGLKERE